VRWCKRGGGERGGGDPPIAEFDEGVLEQSNNDREEIKKKRYDQQLETPP